jgi:hypothetical protein
VKVPQETADNLNLITVVFTIIILVSSLLQYSSGDVVSAEQHHRAGLEMSEIARELAIALPSITTQELIHMSQRYSATLQKYSINHDDVDFQRYQMEKPDDYPWLTWCERTSIRIRTFATRHVYSAILIAITVFFVILVSFYVYPSRLVHASVSIQAEIVAAEKVGLERQHAKNEKPVKRDVACLCRYGAEHQESHDPDPILGPQ